MYLIKGERGNCVPTVHDCKILLKLFFFGRHDICKGINEPCETLGKENNNHFLPFWQPVSCLIESRLLKADIYVF